MASKKMIKAVRVFGDGWISVQLDDFPWEISVQTGEIGGLPAIVGLRLQMPDQPSGKPERYRLTAAKLRQIPLRLLNTAAFAAPRFDLKTLADTRQFPRAGRNALPEEHYEFVAEVYRHAQATAKYPTKAVQEKFAVSRPAASKYVREARRRGILEPPSKPHPDTR